MPTRTTPNAAPATRAPKNLSGLVLPLATRLLREDRDFAATALIVSASVARGGDRALVANRIREQLKDRKADERDFGILALGVLKSDVATPMLEALLLDRSAGRALLGKSGKVPSRVRALAAIALGYSEVDGSVATLRGLLKNSLSPDLRASAIFGLGLAARNGRDIGDVVPYLIERLEDKSWSIPVRSHVPLALAQTGDRAALGALVDSLRKSDAAEVRQSTVLAIGRLTRGMEKKAVHSLLHVARNDRNATVRQFAICALGDITWRVGRRTSSDSAHMLDLVAEFLQEGMRGVTKQSTERPFYALAAGLFASRPGPRRDALRKALTFTAQTGPNPDLRSAAVMGLGLIGDDASRKVLAVIDQKTADYRVKGYVLEARGLARDDSALKALSSFTRHGKSEWLSHQAALGLGHLDNVGAMPCLVATLGETQSVPVSAAVTRAVGTIRDGRSIAPLIRIAEDKNASQRTREWALAALGIVAEKSDVTWTASIKRGINFTTATPAVALVLNLF